jgi:GTP cyclohydrolase II
MQEFHKKRSPDERYITELETLLAHPRTRRRWDDIATMDPMGMTATRPTISATRANMVFPEIHDNLVRDGKIVNKHDGSIKLIKAAIDYVWNVPMVAERIGQDESEMRAALYKYTKQEAVKDPKNKAYLPPLGGCTVYFFGDPSLLSDPKTEVSVRCHDSCCGSDVFGTDICTCRPYLAYAIQAGVECAQRGGVGVIVYYQKEGRSLGEVTKYRVYNARKAQEGGDTPDKYFYVTESIAGIRDARFQEMMPDPLLWLGITKIDILLSMSNEKYDAMVGCGIQIMERVPLPDSFVPDGASIEIMAKVASGYKAQEEVTDVQSITTELRQLTSIRKRCTEVFNLVKEGKGLFFNYDEKKMQACADYVAAVMKSNYPTLDIPYHSRWRHFKAGTVETMQAKWKCDELEKVRRLLDLATISVLLDAGAGAGYHYTDAEGDTFTRSEGLAVASMDMFTEGAFSSDKACTDRVNSLGLQNLTLEDMTHGFQVTKSNPMIGLKGRVQLLKDLGTALDANPEYFGAEVARPGNVLDYVLKHCDDKKQVSINVLWRAVIDGLAGIWPEGQAGVRRGDLWVYSPLFREGTVASDFVPFHKLSQWLTYSLLEPMENMGIKFTDMEQMTGLAEYRNGGVFVDLDVLTLKKADLYSSAFAVGSELVVEWRACTVILLDQLTELIRKKFKKSAAEMPLVKILQGGTWSAGRKIAMEKRPATGGAPPITVRSDGNVF